MGLYLGGLKSRISLALEQEWAYIRDLTVCNLCLINQLKGIVKRAEPYKCDILLASRILDVRESPLL